MKNRKLMGILLGVCIAGMTLVGCSSENANSDLNAGNNENQIVGEDGNQQDAPIDENSTTQQPADTQKPADTQQPSNTTQQNVFYDPNAAQYHMNNVHMQPGRVYWENGQLVAEYVITNGFTDRVVGNINVKEITISNANGKIAAASFGTLQNATIGPRGYITWKFYFGADCIYQSNADLSYLNSVYNLTYNY